jgi:hypothetical protein
VSALPPFEGIDRYTRFYYDGVCEGRHPLSNSVCINIDLRENCEVEFIETDESAVEDVETDESAVEDVETDESAVEDVETDESAIIIGDDRVRQPLGCSWFGNDDTQPFSYCRADMPTVMEMMQDMATMDKHGLVSKAAQFSYIINQFDCYEICTKGSLGLIRSYCSTLKHCCFWNDQENMCRYSNERIAKRYNPRLANLGKMEDLCRKQASWETCAAVPK